MAAPDFTTYIQEFDRPPTAEELLRWGVRARVNVCHADGKWTLTWLLIGEEEA